jgi:hypothetical protein
MRPLGCLGRTAAGSGVDLACTSKVWPFPPASDSVSDGSVGGSATVLGGCPQPLVGSLTEAECEMQGSSWAGIPGTPSLLQEWQPSEKAPLCMWPGQP